MNTDTLTNLFNWIESEMFVQYTPTAASPNHYRDVQFTIRDRSPEALAEVDFRLLHALVIAFEPVGNVTIGVVEGWDTDANLSIGLEGVYVSADPLLGAPSSPGELSDFQMLAIKRLATALTKTRPTCTGIKANEGHVFSDSGRPSRHGADWFRRRCGGLPLLAVCSIDFVRCRCWRTCL